MWSRKYIEIEKYSSTYFYVDSDRTYFTDYKNENGKRPLPDFKYASSAGTGYDYNCFTVYKLEDEIYHIGEEENKRDRYFSGVF
jgi:hypothetical protein